MAKTQKKRVYARIITPLRLVLWQGNAILIGLALNLAFSMWHHEVSMAEMKGKVSTTIRVAKVCSDIGWKDCNEFRKSWKEAK